MTAKPDVIVVGGGVMGLCTAYSLRKRGVAVTVLEMADVGNGSSFGNAGYVSPSHFVPLAAPGVFTQGLKWMFDPTSPLYIKPRLDRDFLEWTWRFARACDTATMERAIPVLRQILFESQDLYEEMFRTDVPGCDYVRRGLTMLYRSEKGRNTALHEHEVAARMGVETRLLDPDGLAAMDPGIEFAAQGGIHFPCDAHLVPHQLVRSLATAVEALGARIERNCRVVRFEQAGGRVTGVQTTRGVFAAREFVLASGAWSARLLRDLGVRLLLQAGKGYSITYRQGTSPAFAPRLPYILMESRVAVTPFPSALRFAGTMEIAGLSTTINRPRVEAILNAVPRYFRDVPRPRSEDGEIWGGMRPVTPDGMPYIGRFRKVPNLVAATGHAMIGVSLAPVTGKIVSEIVCGDEKRSLDLLAPDRFD